VRKFTRASRMASLGMLLISAAACPVSGGGTTGGVTIPQSDSTPPEVSLSVAQQGSGTTVVVKSGGTAGSLNLTAKTGFLNLLASAKDTESGIQDLQIWIGTKVTTCDAGGICTKTGPPLLGAPRFSAPDVTKSPGDTDADTSIMAQAVDLAQEIPQAAPPSGGSRNVTIDIWAVGLNNLGGRAETAHVNVAWQEQG
jgi:hypothetical protein